METPQSKLESTAQEGSRLSIRPRLLANLEGAERSMLLMVIKAEADQWVQAGAKDLGSLACNPKM